MTGELGPTLKKPFNTQHSTTTSHLGCGFKKVSNDAAVKNIIKTTKKIELPHILIYFDENSLN
jgi:hypothetical protein